MKVTYRDGTDTAASLHSGESYLIPPGHLPEVVGDVPCVMIEFSAGAIYIEWNNELTLVNSLALTNTPETV